MIPSDRSLRPRGARVHRFRQPGRARVDARVNLTVRRSVSMAVNMTDRAGDGDGARLRGLPRLETAGHVASCCRLGLRRGGYRTLEAIRNQIGSPRTRSWGLQIPVGMLDTTPRSATSEADHDQSLVGRVTFRTSVPALYRTDGHHAGHSSSLRSGHGQKVALVREPQGAGSDADSACLPGLTTSQGQSCSKASIAAALT